MAVVLASASRIRLALLQNAGVEAVAEAAAVDEQAVKASFRAQGSRADDVAEALAELKAQRVSRRHPGALVVGCDQMLEAGGAWLDKPADRAAAAEQLKLLRGQRHVLISSAVAVRDGHRLWHATARARLTMRQFSDDFLEQYLDRVGDAALSSVGGYQLEGLGAQLFALVEGDYFTVLGLPLLPLLEFLRAQRVIAE